MKPLLCLVACSLILLFASLALQAASLYKCTDESGHVTFSDVECPGTVIEKQTLPIAPAPAMPDSTDHYWSIENQSKRIREQEAAERRERALAELLEVERERQRKAEANQKRAEELRKEAAELYEDAAEPKISKKQQKALFEQARSLERQIDVLLGRRETLAPTHLERLEDKVEEAQETAERVEREMRFKGW